MFLARFPELSSHEGRIFDFYEAQRFDKEIDGKVYQYIKYVTQPEDGSDGEIYYYCSDAADHLWLMKAGDDGTLENATLVPLFPMESSQQTRALHSSLPRQARLTSATRLKKCSLI